MSKRSAGRSSSSRGSSLTSRNRTSSLVPTFLSSVVGSGNNNDNNNNVDVDSSEASNNVALVSTWPMNGNIELKELRIRYRYDLPEVISGSNVSIRGGTKVGVVGRTGSGKSSLLLGLSRLNEICGGQILIDDIDTTSVSLSKLRDAIFVIPQEPHMFSGSIRFNLDPFSQFQDYEIWSALEETKLKSLVDSSGNGLDGIITEAGGNWSMGQRQLLSIARAVLYKKQICVLDEATASVDFETDQTIQKMLRTSSAFKQATLIVIAHRIDTIIDSDLVLVLDNGQLIEQGNPKDLVLQPGGVFASMVQASRVGKESLPMRTQGDNDGNIISSSTSSI
jgi:ABC-type multidrug transport system fused ATPase/permease subunit